MAWVWSWCEVVIVDVVIVECPYGGCGQGMEPSLWMWSWWGCCGGCGHNIVGVVMVWSCHYKCGHVQVAAGAKFEQEIKAEQEKKKKEAEEAKERRAAFKEKASMWK